MTARERILMIRLIERIWKYPSYAETLGIEVVKDSGMKSPGNK